MIVLQIYKIISLRLLKVSQKLFFLHLQIFITIYVFIIRK
jgi:hypothetical protein